MMLIGCDWGLGLPEKIKIMAGESGRTQKWMVKTGECMRYWNYLKGERVSGDGQ